MSQPSSSQSSMPSEHAFDSLNTLSNELYEKINSFDQINRTLHDGLQQILPGHSISCFIMDPFEDKLIDSFSSASLWNIALSEKEWIIKQAKIDHPKSNQVFRIYPLENRQEHPFTDMIQHEVDKQLFDYTCNDGILFVLYGEEGAVYAICFFHKWDDKQPVQFDHFVEKDLDPFLFFFQAVEAAIDNLFIHEKIEGLLSDKKLLTQKIEKDEADLKRRILELTVLYDTSNALGYSLNYSEIVYLMMSAFSNVIQYDLCSILLLDFSPDGEIFMQYNSKFSSSFIHHFNENIISTSLPFINYSLDPSKITLHTKETYHSDTLLGLDDIKSFANIPLIFKEEVIGMIGLCAQKKNVFEHNDMTFLHTMANQLASHLGRIKAVKQAEKSKISSLVRSMTDGVIMFDENNNLELINPSALSLFHFPASEHVTTNHIYDKFRSYNILDQFKQCSSHRQSFNNLEVFYQSESFLVTITPVSSLAKETIGTVVVLKDFTEIQKITRVKSQRLEVISKLNLIIRSIADLDNLLTVLMEFILSIAHAEIGSIQLREGKKLVTRVHSNFPDKIRRKYRFESGETISEYVKRTKEHLYIPDYMAHEHTHKDIKIVIGSYLCIPIMLKKNIIGVVSIARKAIGPNRFFTHDDINTLTTITSLSGSAIENSLLYKDRLEKERLNQELKVAYEIQRKLLPQSIPQLTPLQIGFISVPATEIGGDYYDFFPISKHKSGIILADIVGKGISAGLFMATLKSLLHCHIHKFTSPKEALEAINSMIFHDPVITKYIPLFYGILDTQTFSFVYTNAGHEPPMLFRDNKPQYLDCKGFPIGSYEINEFEERSITLQQNDILLLFTDGIVDAKNAHHIRFGHSQFELFIKKNAHQGAKQICESLYELIKSEYLHQNQTDDLTLLCLKLDKTSPKKSIEKPIKSRRTRISSALKNIKKIRAEFDLLTQHIDLPESERFNVKLAINEAHANVIEHAYFGKEDGEIIFIFDLFKDRIEITIKDFGRGFNQKTIKGEDHLDEIEGSGLGLFLIKNLMDTVQYKKISKFGTELKMIKNIKEVTDGINKIKS